MDETKKIQTLTEELLNKTGLNGQVSVEQADDAFNVVLDAEDNALLIGKHGNTLASLEHILMLMGAKQFGEFKRIILEIGDYRKEREDYLKDLSSRLAEEVMSTGISKTIHGLKPWERRYIHMLLADRSDIKTESEGEGRDRVLVIKKL